MGDAGRDRRLCAGGDRECGLVECVQEVYCGDEIGGGRRCVLYFWCSGLCFFRWSKGEDGSGGSRAYIYSTGRVEEFDGARPFPVFTLAQARLSASPAAASPRTVPLHRWIGATKSRDSRGVQGCVCRGLCVIEMPCQGATLFPDGERSRFSWCLRPPSQSNFRIEAGCELLAVTFLEYPWNGTLCRYCGLSSTKRERCGAVALRTDRYFGGGRLGGACTKNNGTSPSCKSMHPQP